MDIFGVVNRHLCGSPFGTRVKCKEARAVAEPVVISVGRGSRSLFAWFQGATKLSSVDALDESVVERTRIPKQLQSTPVVQLM